MSEDRLLSELGDLARRENEAERARLDERWDRLAAGSLTAEEEAELQALAESSPEDREAYEAFRPLGPEFQARVVDAAAAELPAPRLLPFRRLAARIEVWLGAAAAVAAGLFFLLRGPASLPLSVSFTLSVSVPSESRGEESGSPLPGSRVTLTARPNTAIARPLEARGLLSRAGAEDLRPWQPRPEITINDKGFVILRGRLAKDIQPGPWTAWIVVGRPGTMPTTRDLQAELRAGRRHDAAHHWRADSLAIEVVAPP